MTNIYSLTLSFALLLCCSACNYQSFSGTLIKKPWSKSTQSYCAQGSDYYILKNEEEERVVKYSVLSTLERLDQQRVLIQGKLETIKIEPPNTDLPSQVPDMGPTGQAFTCTILKAKRIKKEK